MVLLEEIILINSKISLELDIAEIEEIFEDTVPLSLNSILLRNWKKAKKKFDSIIQSKSILISIFFREEVVSVSKAKSRPLKVLQNLTKWNALLSMSEIGSSLSA